MPDFVPMSAIMGEVSVGQPSLCAASAAGAPRRPSRAGACTFGHPQDREVRRALPATNDMGPGGGGGPDHRVRPQIGGALRSPGAAVRGPSGSRKAP